MTLAIAVVGMLVGIAALALTTRNYSMTWPGQGVHIRTGTLRGVLTDGFEEHEVTIRVVGSDVAYEAQVVTWELPATSIPGKRPRMDCTSDPFAFKVLVEPGRAEQVWVGVVWTMMYWGRPMEQGYRTTLGEGALLERWHWCLISYLPGQPTSGEWRTVDQTPQGKLTSIPREGDERDQTNLEAI